MRVRRVPSIDVFDRRDPNRIFIEIYRKIAMGERMAPPPRQPPPNPPVKSRVNSIVSCSHPLEAELEVNVSFEGRRETKGRLNWKKTERPSRWEGQRPTYRAARAARALLRRWRRRIRSRSTCCFEWRTRRNGDRTWSCAVQMHVESRPGEPPCVAGITKTSSCGKRPS